MILPNDITNLKTDITDKIGQKIIVKGTLGRSRFFEKEATIEKTYPNLFIVKYDDEERNVTYSYKDVLTRTVEVADPNVTHSLYSVVFCEGNTGWTKNPELNKVFLIQQQNHANDRLRLNGVLFLNEVYDMLGVPRTAYGQIAGWVYTEDSTAGDPTSG